MDLFVLLLKTWDGEHPFINWTNSEWQTPESLPNSSVISWGWLRGKKVKELLKSETYSVGELPIIIFVKEDKDNVDNMIR